MADGPLAFSIQLAYRSLSGRRYVRQTRAIRKSAIYLRLARVLGT